MADVLAKAKTDSEEKPKNAGEKFTQRRWDIGKSFLARKQMRQAASAFDSALQSLSGTSLPAPRVAALHTDLATALEGLDEFPRAAEHYNKALDILGVTPASWIRGLLKSIEDKR